MTATHKELAIKALRSLIGDDLLRAKAAFRRYTPEQMDTEYGLSRKTCAEILAEYEAHEAKVNAAIEWVRSQP